MCLNTILLTETVVGMDLDETDRAKTPDKHYSAITRKHWCNSTRLKVITGKGNISASGKGPKSLLVDPEGHWIKKRGSETYNNTIYTKVGLLKLILLDSLLSKK